MPKILISDALSNLANEGFERNNIEVDTQTDLTPNELKDIINQYDGLVVRSATKATDEIISAGSKLKIIGRAGAGGDNFDLASAKKYNVILKQDNYIKENAAKDLSKSKTTDANNKREITTKEETAFRNLQKKRIDK